MRRENSIVLNSTSYEIRELLKSNSVGHNNDGKAQVSNLYDYIK
jgi:hypothetical protein